MKTIRFKFKQTGLNAHTAEGTLTYSTPKLARQAADRLRQTKGFSDVVIH